MKRAALLLLLPALVLAAVPAADSPRLERLPLFTPAELKLWSTAESTAANSADRHHDGAPTLHWHVTVDYQTGEPKYPIGWPRVNRSLPVGPLRDWSGWDYLHGWIFVSSSRIQLPATPAGLGLHTPDRTGAFQRPLTDLRVGQWTELKIPISAIPRAHDVRQIQFHVAEQNYRDGDRLDFYFSDLALVRHAAPTLLHFSPESPVQFADARQVPVRLQLAGVPPDTSIEVRCELRREGRATASAALQVRRGTQVLPLPLGPGPLPPGDYELRASLPGQVEALSARIRFVASPWN